MEEIYSVPEPKSYLSVLNDYQLDILAECLNHEHTAISVPMGGGKTSISLVLATETTNLAIDQILIICKKSLIKTWTDEIKRIFGDEIMFTVLHSEYKRPKNVNIHLIPIVITTPEVLRKYYMSMQLEDRLIERDVQLNYGQHLQSELLRYRRNLAPIAFQENVDAMGNMLYGRNWGTLIVDEFHTLSNILSNNCRSILSIVAQRKWCLSGTFLSEATPENILAFFTFINDPTFPDNLPKTSRFVKSRRFKGIAPYIVSRNFLPQTIETIDEIITVPFNAHESLIYTSIRDLVLGVAADVALATAMGHDQNRRMFSGQLLAMLIYLRQCIVSPLIPIATLSLDVCNLSSCRNLALKMKEQIQALNIYDYLDNEENIISSRIQKVVELTKKHDKVVIFTSFRTNATLLLHILQTHGTQPHSLYTTIDGSQSLKKRAAVVDACRAADSFVLVLTYKLGGAGLNLQVANTVIFTEYEWNICETLQAKARVARFGQEQEVRVYYLVSNTGVEQAVLKKQLEKQKVRNEIEHGRIKTSIKRIKIQEIVIFLRQEAVQFTMRSLRAAAETSNQETDDMEVDEESFDDQFNLMDDYTPFDMESGSNSGEEEDDENDEE